MAPSLSHKISLTTPSISSNSVPLPDNFRGAHLKDTKILGSMPVSDVAFAVILGGSL